MRARLLHNSEHVDQTSKGVISPPRSGTEYANSSGYSSGLEIGNAVVPVVTPRLNCLPRLYRGPCVAEGLLGVINLLLESAAFGWCESSEHASAPRRAGALFGVHGEFEASLLSHEGALCARSTCGAVVVGLSREECFCVGSEARGIVKHVVFDD